MLSDELEKKCTLVKQLSKSESIKIQRKWLDMFAAEVKERTGKWRIGEHLWEGFSSGIQPSYLNAKAIEKYREEALEVFYIIDESGKHGFKCESSEHPEFYNSGEDLYLMPENCNWTIVFCHDNVVYYAEK